MLHNIYILDLHNETLSYLLQWAGKTIDGLDLLIANLVDVLEYPNCCEELFRLEVNGLHHHRLLADISGMEGIPAEVEQWSQLDMKLEEVKSFYDEACLLVKLESFA